MELNAEQIIRGLEICTTTDDCVGCPYLIRRGDSAILPCTIDADALALIKQLTEENERLRAENTIYSNNVERIAENYHRQGRADTVREIQERLHRRFGDDANRVFSNYNIHRYIDQIAKEMLEEEQ